MALLSRSTALPLLLLLALLCTTALFVNAAESESQAEASTELQAGAEASWKPRSYPRTNNVNRAPARHRFFLPNPADYTATDGDYFYRMNVCGPVNAGGSCGNALVCQYKADTTTFVAKIAVYDGYFGPRLTLLDGNNPGLGVQAHYLNGDICFLGAAKRRNPRTTIVQYKCGKENKDSFEIHEDKETCTFTITLHTPHACWPLGSLDGVAGGISQGTSFLILFALAVALYLGIGVVWNKQQGKEGKEALPHLEWWTVTLPLLVADGVAYSGERFEQFKETRLKNGAGGLLGGNQTIDPDDPYRGQGAPTARTDDL